MTLTSENHYASVLVVSLDEEILSRSQRILVQVGTRARPTDWVERESTFTADGGKETINGKKVISTGRMPWAIEKTHITLSVKNPGLTKATALDLNGNASKPIKIDDAGEAFKLNLPVNTLYAVLESE